MTRSVHNNQSFRTVGTSLAQSSKTTIDGDAECIESCAAEYIRMSTEHQRYSIENQKAAIAVYAAQHKLKIVRSYIDPGKSGLRIEHRDALRQLIDDVQSGDTNFKIILVYDVSRWGRFQDIDESAYYEFLCKKNGVPIHYCAEQFENNGNLVDQIVKGLKRAMAGEYSRELSVKVFEAQKLGAQRGIHQGGVPPYGLCRLAIDECGGPRVILKPQERKSYKSDHVVLVPGPSQETRTIRRIFRLFVHSHMARKCIAQLLNKEGIPNARGNRWTDNNVLRILTNEKYIGNVVYGRTSKKLSGPCFHNPRDNWTRATGALQRIVDPELFASAQRILKDPWWAFTDNRLLDHLSAALCKNGYLSARLIAESRFAPSVTTYRERFGNLTNAYRLIGYKQTHGYYHCKPEVLRSAHRNLISKLISLVQNKGGTIQFDEAQQTLQLNGTVTVAVVIIPYIKPKADRFGWVLRLYYFPKCDLILAARLDKTNQRIFDYYLLPRDVCPRTILQFTKQNLTRFTPHKFRSLATFYKQYEKLSLDIATSQLCRTEQTQSK